MLQQQMNRDLHAIALWFDMNQLSLNVKKTNYMLFCKDAGLTSDLDISIRNHCISRVMSFKYLGIQIDGRLSWENQISKLVPQLRAANRLLYKLQNVLPLQYLKMLYYAYSHSYLSYMPSIWGLANQLLVNKLRVLQNGAMRIMLRVNKRSISNKQLYVNTRVTPLDVIIKSSLASIVLLHVKSVRCTSVLLSISQRNIAHTRSSDNLKLPRVSSVRYGTHGHCYQSCLTYNKLPLSVKNSQSLVSIKRDLRSYFYNKYLEGSLQTFENYLS